MEAREKADILNWKKEQFLNVAEESIDKIYFKPAAAENEIHVFADAFEETICAVAFPRSQPKEYSDNLAFVN